MVGDAAAAVETKKKRPAWARMGTGVGATLLFLSHLVDLRLGDMSLSPYLLATGALVSVVFELGETRRWREDFLPLVLFAVAFGLVKVGRDVIDGTVAGLPVAYVLAAAVALPAGVIVFGQLVDEAKKNPTASLLGAGVLAFVGILLLEDSGWNEEVFWHVQQHEALQFWLGTVIALAVCAACRSRDGLWNRGQRRATAVVYPHRLR
jgi:drug/metabolite transporter (DMT)-like permease